MIRHIVFFSARDPSDVEAIVDGLKPLAGIASVRRLEVSRNIKRDQLGNDVDVVVYGEFDDEAGLAAYKADPIYAEAVRRVRPLRELRIAADISVPG